ncbi:DEKNAAC103958 [Brettanomyces naardenensis]|uniref:DEKNAAC103958 n=1 Tax=Brettanomyces naardenensis TaxID=13370 RepID=A0A448YPR5_BRENA|nr:DEKNAAC103958 [Brettanomyces naardenensis]
MPRIRPLDKTVVNRIAAGEIIIAPSNALKEMLENSIDANSTNIEIGVKDGGLKFLQITDNGSGIDKDDLPLLCERFTTSKLTKFEDLQSISTYGFRGEALASISHISHLSVITKTAKDECAWKCYYLDGKLVPPPTGGNSEPRPIAGKDGTSIIVEDLFYNVPSRLRSLRSHSEEYARILDVVSKYAIHTGHIGFTCKKLGGSSTDLVIRKDMSRRDRIRTVFGSSVANELVEVNVDADLDIGLNRCYGYVTNSNYENKKSIRPVIFINNRLVACDPLRRAINQLYTTYLPKGHKPFIYLALEIDPKDVDVNVHPTKREVRFLNEEEIIERISSGIEAKLSSLDSSRKFLTQQVITVSQRVEERQEKRLEEEQVADEERQPRKKRAIGSIQQFKRPYEKEMVRTDFSQSTLASFVSKDSGSIGGAEIEDGDDTSDVADQKTLPTIINLASVKELRKEVQSEASREFTALFAKHSIIGVADFSRRLLCLQYDVRLYLVDYASVCNEFFYQVGLSDFGNFGKIRFTNPVDIKALLQKEIYDNKELMEQYADPLALDELVQSVYVEMAEMLNEYFSIEIDNSIEGEPKLVTIPMLVKNYMPSFNKLSLFLFKVGNNVNWEDEKECLGGILRQLALLYVPEPLDDDAEEDRESREKTGKFLEDVIFPLIKKRFIGTKNLVRDVVEIANLPGLYKVFERC